MPPPNDYKKIIVSQLSAVLKMEGFKKAGNDFHKEHNDLVYYVSLQSSQASTSETRKCTVNIEIASKTLYKLEDTSIPEHLRRHYQKRIGGFLSGNSDKWWTVNSIDNAQTASQEIGDILKPIVLPELLSIQSTPDLKALWERGYSPGITDPQRKEYLALLAAWLTN